MNEIILIIVILLIFCLGTIGGIIYYFSGKFRQMEEQRRGDSGLQFLNQNVQALHQAVSDRLDRAAQVMMAVNSELGQMREIGSNLKNIQDFLKSPKLRGNLSEQGLKDLLSQALPRKCFDLQYTFRSGTIVDAIIHLESGKIPIDAKFPLENFNQVLKSKSDEERAGFRRKFKADFRLHVNNIARKYINPDEGTTDFAFMYLPSENIFFEIINNENDLYEYAAKQHVVVSSPSSFFYYLRTIMLGFEGRKISKMSQEILQTLKSLQNESTALDESLSVLNRHILNSAKTMSTVNERFTKLSNKISKVGELESNQEKYLIKDK